MFKGNKLNKKSLKKEAETPDKNENFQMLILCLKYKNKIYCICYLEKMNMENKASNKKKRANCFKNVYGLYKNESTLSFLHGDEGLSEGWTLSEYCSQKEFFRLPIAFQRR